MLDVLVAQLMAVQSRLVQFPNTYYFHEGDERFELSTAVPYLLRLAEEAGREECSAEVRLHAAVLRKAIDDFSATVGTRFLNLPGASTRGRARSASRAARWWWWGWDATEQTQQLRQDGILGDHGRTSEESVYGQPPSSGAFRVGSRPDAASPIMTRPRLVTYMAREGSD